MDPTSVALAYDWDPMAMTNRTDLLSMEEASWVDFLEAVNAVPADDRQREGVVPGWSTHDVVWHCAYWSEWAGRALENISAGGAAEASEDPEDEILAHGRTMPWEEMLANAEKGRVRLRSALTALADPVSETAVQTVRGETFDHYSEHAAQIRATFP
jgi:23S rRNA G2445 N2-methylase RlmL